MRLHKVFLVAMGVTLLSLAAGAQEGEKVAGAKAQAVREAIPDYIQRDIKLKGSFFLFGPELKRVVGFKFDLVHEGVTRSPRGQFLPCVDLRSVRGPLYDLDVYLEEDGGTLRPVKLVIHKVDGVKREEKTQPR